MTDKKLDVGKLDSELLKKLVFNNIEGLRDEVLVRPTIGEDCAIVDYGENSLVISTDPITGTSKEIGKLAVHINCNDIASSGVAPIGIMITLMVPPGTRASEIEYIMKQANEEAAKLNVEIIGGHTEVTDAVNKIIISATAVGSIKTENVKNKEVIKPSYKIVMTKSAGLEGTGIIAYELEDKLSDALGKETVNKAKELLSNVSVVREGVIAGKLGITSLHDVTEGGLLGGVWELCDRIGLGCELHYDKIFITDETKSICDYLDINPLRLISSGTMIMISDDERIDKLMVELKSKGIKCNIIGEIKEGEMKLIIGDKEEIINPPKSDELYKVL